MPALPSPRPPKESEAVILHLSLVHAWYQSPIVSKMDCGGLEDTGCDGHPGSRRGADFLSGSLLFRLFLLHPPIPLPVSALDGSPTDASSAVALSVGSQ